MPCAGRTPHRFDNIGPGETRYIGVAHLANTLDAHVCSSSDP